MKNKSLNYIHNTVHNHYPICGNVSCYVTPNYLLLLDHDNTYNIHQIFNHCFDLSS